MRYIKMGNSTWEASQVVLGIMRISKLAVDEAVEVLTASFKAGINFIDSADIYGNEKSEEIFAEALPIALKNANLTREDIYIQSKGGIVIDPKKSTGEVVFGQRFEFSKKQILESVEGILKRMNIKYLDAFLLHRPDPLMELEEIKDAFDILQKEGKVRHFGLSNVNPGQINLIQANINQKIMFNQVQFSIMHTGMIDAGLHVNMKDERSLDHDGGIIEYCRLHNITLQSWSPFQYGFFGGTFIDSKDHLELNEKLAELAKKYKVSKNAIAVAWITRHPANIQVIIGTMNIDRIKDSAKGADIRLTNQEWYDLYFAAGNDLP
ncbi:MAG: aldo/keto reductase [Acholeplasmataceae bacterium]